MYDIQYRMHREPRDFWPARHMWLPSLSLLRPRIPQLKLLSSGFEERQPLEAHDKLDAVLIAFDFAIEESGQWGGDVQQADALRFGMR